MGKTYRSDRDDYNDYHSLKDKKKKIKNFLKSKKINKKDNVIDKHENDE